MGVEYVGEYSGLMMLWIYLGHGYPWTFDPTFLCTLTSLNDTYTLLTLHSKVLLISSPASFYVAANGSVCYLSITFPLLPWIPG